MPQGTVRATRDGRLFPPTFFENGRKIGSVRRIYLQSDAGQNNRSTDTLSGQVTLTSPMGEWVKAGKIRYREETIEDLEDAPATFVGLLKGEAFGKRVVKLTA